MSTHLEPARDTPIVEEVDVLVAGGGPAGVCAALAAAAAGASVRLIEQHGCLGGIWTSGLLAWILDHRGKGGLLASLIAELERRGAAWPIRGGACSADPEAVKLLLEERCLAAGVRVRLHTRLAAAACAGGRVAVAIGESKSGREAWAARAFVDASGDGDLAARAGCGWAYGRPEDGAGQPMSLICLLAGPPRAVIAACVHDGEHGGRAKDALLALLRANGAEPSYGRPSLFPIADGLYALMANHEYGARGLDAQQLSDATIRARAELHRLLAALHRAGGPWAGMRIVATAAQIGVREGRRIRGRHVVTADEVVAGVRHPDPVCRVAFPVDVHALHGGGDKSFAAETAAIRARPYDIPLRALVAADRDGLLLAGRCISGDFIAHSSYRVTGDAAALGEAAGTCAALAARTGRLPHEVGWDEVAERLPGVRGLRVEG